MPRTVPSQVVSYLTQIFNRRAPLAAAVVLQKIGAVAGFLELYDQLPAELIRLSADDYAILISEIGTIRFRIDQYRRGAAWGHLEPVGPALDKVWEIIEKLQDEVPSTAHDLSFIADPELREMIGLDVAAISTDRQSGEWKGATILAGSCCEALLLFALTRMRREQLPRPCLPPHGLARPPNPPISPTDPGLCSHMPRLLGTSI